MSDFTVVLITAALVAGITYASGVAAEMFQVSRRVIRAALQFAAGLITALVAFSLMPPAVENGPLLFVALAFFLGSAVFVLIEYVTARYLAAKDSGESPQLSSIGFYFGVLIDVLIDGVVIGIAFALSIRSGLLLAVGMTLHKIPLAFTTIATAKAQGLPYRMRRTLKLLFVGCILTGVILGFFLLHNQPEAVLLSLTALASGFLFTAVTQSMIPEANRDSEPSLSPIFFAIGLTVYALLTFSVG